eukprot:g1142.t1
MGAMLLYTVVGLITLCVFVGVYLSLGRTTKGYRVSGMKQGAYGRVPILSTHSKLSMLLRPAEIFAAIRYKFRMKAFRKKNAALLSKESQDYVWCCLMLSKVSRSFAGVIAQLPGELRKCVCIFYLVLRALDTVEDEMELSKFSPYVNFDRDEIKTDEIGGDAQQRRTTYLRDAKVRLIVNFTQRLYEDDTKNIVGIGEGAEKELVEHFDRVRRVFQSLPQKYQCVIADISERMSRGMARYIGRDLRNGTTHVKDYDRYCEIVAGYVGEGLSELWVASGLEDPSIVVDREAIFAMGLFLQKTNIIRDYLEDLTEGRTFWPKEIWKHHARSLSDLSAQDPEGRCVNSMVCDALLLLPACLRYLRNLKTPSIFRFCAIPQLMAIATLSHVQKHSKLVYKGVLKIRKTQAAHLIVDVAKSHAATDEYIRNEGMRVASRIIKASDRSESDSISRLRVIGRLLRSGKGLANGSFDNASDRPQSTLMSVGSVVTAAALGYGLRQVLLFGGVGTGSSNFDAGAVAVLCMSLVYLYVAIFMSTTGNGGRIAFRGDGDFGEDSVSSLSSSSSKSLKKPFATTKKSSNASFEKNGQRTFYNVQEPIRRGRFSRRGRSMGEEKKIQA